MSGTPHRTLLVGWRGGVGQALLALLDELEREGAGEPAGAWILLDAAEGPPHPRHETLPALEIRDAGTLATIGAETGATRVVGLADLDSLECARALGERGIDFLCTSLERWPDAPPHTSSSLFAAGALLPGSRPTLPGSHLIGSGMNPGIVSLLIPLALREFAARTERPPTAGALDLYAVYFTESDRSEFAPPPAGTFAMTWSPRQCLQELTEPTAAYVRARRVELCPHPPWRERYLARCGDEVVAGCCVPHDEVLTAAHGPWLADAADLELAYLYALPGAAVAALGPLARGITPRPAPTSCVPSLAHQHDRVGVLLCSRSLGELWLGFEGDGSARFPQTSSTLLQVAAGVIGGLGQLGEVAGVHTPDELDPTRYLAAVTAILGPWTVVHDRQACPRRLSERRPDPLQDPARGAGQHPSEIVDAATEGTSTSR
jgi:hypothetical protein